MYYINGIKLPHSVYAGQDEEKVATALGFVAQYISLLSGYLGLALRYPIDERCSRSSIFDPITQLPGPKKFPLHKHGSEKWNFEYAVFLLNKDIEQLMNCMGVAVKNLRHTLPNLILLREAVSRRYQRFSLT